MHPITVPTALEALDQRLTAILMALRPLIAHHFLRHPWVPNAVTVPLWNRLGRYARRLSALMAAFAAGRLPRPHLRHHRAAGAGAGSTPPQPLPRRHGWMLAAMGWHVAVYRNQIAALLDTPEMATFLAAAPGAGRLLRPLCHMLGVRHASLGVRHASLTMARPASRRPAGHRSTRSGPAMSSAANPVAGPPEPASAPAPRLCPHLLARWPFSLAEPPAPRAAGPPLLRLSAPRLALPLTP